jgi:hypothetical protein
LISNLSFGYAGYASAAAGVFNGTLWTLSEGIIHPHTSKKHGNRQADGGSQVFIWKV